MNSSKKEIVSIFLISFIFAAVFNAFSSTGLPYIYEKSQTESSGEITAQEAKKMNEDSNYVFLDARPARYYKREHIPGAVNVPYNTKELDKLIEPFIKGQKFVVYCYSETCNMARLLRDALTTKGFTSIILFDEGIKAWKLAGYATELTQD